MEQHFVEEPCQESWHRPVLSLFAKVFTVFSCKLPKVACFQKRACRMAGGTGSHPQQRKTGSSRLRLSVFKFNLKWTVIFLLRKFSCLHPQQAGQAGTNSQFLNQILQIRIQKRLLGFSQTRHSAQNCADRASYPLKAL